MMNIDTEFRRLIPALRDEEYAALEQSIIDEGCRDALVVWRQGNILLDGHNRYDICMKHKIGFNIIHLDFESRYDAKLWMIHNQLARRNVTLEQREYLIAERYELEKQEQGGTGANQYTVQSDKICHSAKTRQAIADEFGVSQGTVQNAVEFKTAIDAIAEHDENVRDAILAGELDIPRGEIRQLAGVLKKEPEVAHAAIDELVAGNAKRFKQAITYVRREARAKEAQAIPEGIFNVVYADPPWQYSNSGLGGSAESHYPTMPTADICALLDQFTIADNAVLFLWATNPLLEDALQVINAWGFSYKTNMVWEKGRATYGMMGFYAYANHELLLIATRGSCQPDQKPDRTVFHESKGEHSSKPHLFRELIERMYPNRNYLELFARNQPPRDRWTFWGNEQ